jgi:hypothetical protein
MRILGAELDSLIASIPGLFYKVNLVELRVTVHNLV